jgi:hypothetical protein
MHRVVQSLAAVGGLLGAMVALGEGASGCYLRGGMGAQGDGGGDADGQGGQENASTATTGPASSSAGVGGGGHVTTHTDQTVTESGADGQFSLGGTEANPIEIYSRTTTTIRGKFHGGESDGDELHFITREDAVLRFDTSNANSADLGCSNLHVRLEWTKPPPFAQPQSQGASSSDDDQIGISPQEAGAKANCSSMTYYLESGTALGLKVITEQVPGFSDSEYIVRVRSLPLRFERDINKGASLINDDDFQEDNEVSVAISGLASGSKPDEYRIKLTKKAVRIEIIEGMLDPGYSCEGDDYDFTLEVSSVGGVGSAVTSTQSGRGGCPMLDGFGPTPKDSQLRDIMSEKRIFVRPDGNSVTPYTLVVSAQQKPAP